jgi:hypothetical protein
MEEVMTVREVIDLLESIAQKEGDQTECIVEIEEENYNTEAEIHTVCTNGYPDGAKKICLLGTKDEEAIEE